MMMKDVDPMAGKYRNTQVAIKRGKKIIHLPPPPEFVSAQMSDLLKWLKYSDEHPLVKGAVFHYELEFIHPFTDGNGRTGRFYNTLVYSLWKKFLGNFSFETIISECRQSYYQALGECDRNGESTVFVEFITGILLKVMLGFFVFKN
jgi:Fic family protein